MTETGRQDTGRQDIVAPEPPVDESNPIPQQQRQGIRLWLGIGAVTVVFLVILAIVIINQ